MVAEKMRVDKNSQEGYIVYNKSMDRKMISENKRRIIWSCNCLEYIKKKGYNIFKIKMYFTERISISEVDF